jgi:hypothetical protein
VTTSLKSVGAQSTGNGRNRKAEPGARTGARPKCRFVKVCDYPYRDPRGRELFVKVRFRHDPCLCGRGKSFAYSWETPWDKDRYGNVQRIGRKPPDADWYLYRLDEIYPFIARGSSELIYWCEGEKDADELTRAYHVAATSHHQGAGKATLQQASWLAKAKHVVIVADLDDPGAYCAALRHDLLRDAGCKGQIDIIRAAAGNDAADHIAAGYRLGEFVPADLDRLQEAVLRYKTDLKENHATYTRD